MVITTVGDAKACVCSPPTRVLRGDDCFFLGSVEKYNEQATMFFAPPRLRGFAAALALGDGAAVVYFYAVCRSARLSKRKSDSELK